MSDDVLITPASRKVEFFDSGGNIDGKIELSGAGDLNITSSGKITIGDITQDIHIGDGTQAVDLVFDFTSSIYSVANQDLTIGKSSLGGNDVLVDSPNWSVTQGVVLDVANLKIASAQGSDGQVLTSTGSGVGWEDAGGGAVSAVANGANNRVATFSSADALNGEANMTFNGSDLVVDNGATAKVRAQGSSNYAATLVAIAQGAHLAMGDVDSAEDQWLKFGAFGGINNLDTKTRDFHLYGTNTTTGFYFDESAGKFGIGTASPDTSLHVKGSGLQYLKLESTDNNAGVQVMSDSLDSWLIYSPDGTPDLRFFTDTGYSVSADAADLVDVMTLDGTNHRVGIGDTSPNGVLHVYRNNSATTVPLLKLHEDSVYADNATLEITTDRTDGAIPSISVSGGAVTVSGPNGWNTWEKETFYKHSYGTATGQGSGLINVSHNGVGTINSITLPYDAKLRAVVITYTFNTSTSSTTDQTWRLFHSGNPSNVVSDFVFDVDNDMTNTHGNFFVYTATGLDVTMNKNKTYSVRREGGSLNIQSAVRFDLWYTRHTTNF